MMAHYVINVDIHLLDKKWQLYKIKQTEQRCLVQLT